MTTWKIIRIYKLKADSKRQALAMFHSAEYTGGEREFLSVEFAVEDRPQGFWAQLMSQIFG